MSFVVGDYRATELIGAGGSAQVWRGVVMSTGAPVAMKIFAPDQLGQARREAALAAAVDHPHVVQVLDVVGDAERAALITEYAAGGDLADLLVRRGRLSAAETLTVVLPLAAALATAHERHVVHGDVSAANVVLDAAGRPLLADLGAGRAAAEGGRPVAITAPDAAPELAKGASPCAATDMFSLGSLALACLTGRHAWPADDLRDVLIQSAAGQWPDPDDADGPPLLISAIRALLQGDADLRPGAASLVMDLRAAGRPEPLDLRAGPVPAAPFGPVVGGGARDEGGSGGDDGGGGGGGDGAGGGGRGGDSGGGPVQMRVPGRHGSARGSGDDDARLDVGRIERARAVTRIRPDAVGPSAPDGPARPRRVRAFAVPRAVSPHTGSLPQRVLPPVRAVGPARSRRSRSVRITLLSLVALTVAGLAGAGGLWWANWDRTDPVALPQVSAVSAAGPSGMRAAAAAGPGTISSARPTSTAAGSMSPSTPPASPTTSTRTAGTADQDFTATVRGLDDARAKALMGRDASLLDAVYTPDAAARSADARMIASLISGGLRLSGAVHVVQHARIVGSAPLRVEVSDSLPSYLLLDAGGSVVGSTVARAGAARVMVLVKTAAGYRISAVQ